MRSKNHNNNKIIYDSRVNDIFNKKLKRIKKNCNFLINLTTLHRVKCYAIAKRNE